MTTPATTAATTVVFPECRGCADKIRVIDALQAQLRDVREELRSTQHELTVTDAKLEEARRALDRCMGFRS